MRLSLIFAMVVVCVFAPFSSLPASEGSYDVSAGLSTAVIQRADNLWGGGRRAIKDIRSKPEAMTKLRLFPVLEIIVRPGGQEVGHSENLHIAETYLTTNKEPGAVSAGAKFGFGKNYLDIYGFYFFYASQWKNPYASYRRPTSTYNYGGKVTWGNIAGTDLSLSYRLSTIDVDDDLIGAMNRDLRQDGTAHTVAVAYRYDITEAVTLTPQISYEKGAYDGKSNSYDGYEGSLSLNVRLKRAMVLARAYGGKNRFERKHPFYGKARDEANAGGLISVTFLRPFDLEKTTITTAFIAGIGDSNITFFDRYTIGGLLSFSHRF